MQKTTKRQYQLLGKVLSRQHPELANELLEKFCSHEAVESDFSNISHYYQDLCSHLGIKPEDYQGSVWTQEKINVRRLFISVMIRGYCPELHKQPLDNLMPPVKFGKYIIEALNVEKSSISRTIRQVILYEKTYEDYKNKVDQLTEHIFYSQLQIKNAC